MSGAFQFAAAGLLIGLATVPGAFVACWLMARIPLKVHTLLMEAVVLIGGTGFLSMARRLLT